MRALLCISLLRCAISANPKGVAPPLQAKGVARTMRHDTPLLLVFFLIETLTLLLLPVYSAFDIALFSGLGALLAALISARHKSRRLRAPGVWPSGVACALVAATLFAALYSAKLYLNLVVNADSGARFLAPQLDLGWTFIKGWSLSLLTVGCALAWFDQQVMGAPLAEAEPRVPLHFAGDGSSLASIGRRRSAWLPGLGRASRRDKHFVALFLVLAALMVLGNVLWGLERMGLVLTTCIATLGAVRLTQRVSAQRCADQPLWPSVLFCALAAACLFAALVIACRTLVLASSDFPWTFFEVIQRSLLPELAEAMGVVFITVATLLGLLDARVLRGRFIGAR